MDVAHVETPQTSPKSDPSGREMSDHERRSKQEAGLEAKKAEKMKAESRLSVFKSRIRACGGGRCG